MTTTKLELCLHFEVTQDTHGLPSYGSYRMSFVPLLEISNRGISSVHCTKHSHSTLEWRHNGHDGVSNHRRLDCLFKRLFRRRSKKTSKLRVTDLCEGNSPGTGTGEFPGDRCIPGEFPGTGEFPVNSRGPVNSQRKWPVTRKIVLFDDVIMHLSYSPVCLTGHLTWDVEWEGPLSSWLLTSMRSWVWITAWGSSEPVTFWSSMADWIMNALEKVILKMLIRRSSTQIW